MEFSKKWGGFLLFREVELKNFISFRFKIDARVLFISKLSPSLNLRLYGVS
jgi:hypothetical protein